MSAFIWLLCFYSYPDNLSLSEGRQENKIDMHLCRLKLESLDSSGNSSMSFKFATFLKFSPVHNLPFWRKKGRIEMDSSHLNHWIFPKIIQQSSFSTSNVTFHSNLKQKKNQRFVISIFSAGEQYSALRSRIGVWFKYRRRPSNNSFYYINCSVLQGYLPPRNVVSEHT